MNSARNLISPVAQALIRAVCPGPAPLLRSISAEEWPLVRRSGERFTMEFDLPDAQARQRAFALCARADGDGSYADVGLPSAMLVGLAAGVRGDVLTVEAAVIHD